MEVQARTVWTLLDKASSRNLISQQDYEAIPQPVTVRPRGSLILVPRNNRMIPLLGWITLRFTISTRSAYQEFGVVKILPIDMLIG